MSKAEDKRLKGRAKKGWREGAKEALGHRSLDTQKSDRHVWDRLSCGLQGTACH